MGTPLRVLVVEDSEDDTLLLAHELRRGGYDVTHRRVESRASMQAALAGEVWDVVLSDYRMPYFSAPEALRVLMESGRDLPFIIVSGTVGEETAVACMRAGAHDYLLKGNLIRLCAAVEREVREAQIRLARRQAEERLRRHAERLKILHDIDRAILAAQSPETIAGAALHHLRTLLAFQWASVVLFDFAEQEATRLSLEAEGGTMLKAGARFPLAVFGDVGLLRQGQVQAVEDVASLAQPSPIVEALKAEGLRSYIQLPLLAGGELIGALNLGASRPRTFSPEERDIAREVADQLAVAIQQARLRDQVQRHAAELEQKVEARTRELQAANRQLEAASRHKSEFLANMSHELRTPLNSIIGFADLLLNQGVGPLSEKQARYLGHIHQGGKHLLQLISDILDLSKVEAGKFLLQPEALTVGSTLEDILVIGRGLAHKKSQTVTAVIEAGLPPLRADPVRFKQILFNLLSNAVKFTPEGGTITVRAFQQAGGSGPPRGYPAAGSKPEAAAAESLPTADCRVPSLVIEVTDTGVGIRAGDMPRLFQEFVQLEATATARHEGTGLGLALTKRLVEMHGGTIRAESKGQGHGATFTLVLPFAGPVRPSD